MNVYRLRVSIMGISKVYRIIEVSGNCTFDDLHEAIFEAFDRYDHHLYSFFLTRKDTQNIHSIYDAPEITHPQATQDPFGFGTPKKSAARAKIDDAGLKEKEVFHYWFDFGDDWWHRIRVQSVRESPSKKKHIQMVKWVGESPPQYEGLDEDDE